MIPVGNDSLQRKFPFFTWLLIVVNVGVFLHELRLSPRDLEAFILHWGVTPGTIWLRGEETALGALRYGICACITSTFLHGGWLHLIGNMWSLWLFGSSIEDHLGHLRFVFFYVTCGLLAGSVHVALNLGSGVPTIGASGAVAGVMGAYFLLCPFTWIKVVVPVLFIPLIIKVPAVVYLLLWIITQFVGAYHNMGGDAGAGKSPSGLTLAAFSEASTWFADGKW